MGRVPYCYAMFGLGMGELLVILVVVLLVLGPKRLPEIATQLGKAIRQFRSVGKDLRDQIEVDDDVRRPIEELRSALRDEPPPIPRPGTVTAAAPLPAAADKGVTGQEADKNKDKKE